jgi:glycerate dehydrogenase
MKIAVLEKVSLGNDLDISFFDEFGEVVYYENTVAGDIAKRVSDADVIIANRHCKQFNAYL